LYFGVSNPAQQQKTKGWFLHGCPLCVLGPRAPFSVPLMKPLSLETVVGDLLCWQELAVSTF